MVWMTNNITLTKKITVHLMRNIPYKKKGFTLEERLLKIS